MRSIGETTWECMFVWFCLSVQSLVQKLTCRFELKCCKVNYINKCLGIILGENTGVCLQLSLCLSVFPKPYANTLCRLELNWSLGFGIILTESTRVKFKVFVCLSKALCQNQTANINSSVKKSMKWLIYFRLFTGEFMSFLYMNIYWIWTIIIEIDMLWLTCTAANLHILVWLSTYET